MGLTQGKLLGQILDGVSPAALSLGGRHLKVAGRSRKVGHGLLCLHEWLERLLGGFKGSTPGMKLILRLFHLIRGTLQLRGLLLAWVDFNVHFG